MREICIKKYVSCIYVALLLFALPIQASDYKHSVEGSVVDNITGMGVTAKITLMTADSVVIDTITADIEEMPWDIGYHKAYYEFKDVVTSKGKYIIKAEKEGYDVCYMNCELRGTREDYIKVKEIRMTKIVEHELKEVTVVASKVKMVMKGDTIVYNANAFNLAEGNMLDALIARLPGAKLEKDGRIYVNGRFIQSLLVNGQEFFAGNPKLALENLPAYTVNNIKVYNKAGTKSRLMQRNMGDNTYVMDVRLKRQYATGYMGDLEAGGGTQKRYKLRGFGMKFSDKERMGAFFNINNLNDNQRAELTGEWEPQDVGNGLLTVKNAGISYVRFLNNERSWVSTGNTWQHISTDNESITHTQTYLPEGNSFLHNHSKQLNSSDKWESINHLSIDKTNYSTSNSLSISYLRNNGLGSTNSATANETTKLNTLLSRNSFESSDFNFDFSTGNYVKYITDLIRGDFSVSYNRNKQKQFMLNNVQYLQGGQPNDNRNNYFDMPNQKLKLFAGVGYDINIRKTTFAPSYSYTYTYNKASNLLYRLDWLAGRDINQFNVLPSASNALLSALDNNNSYCFNEYRNEHRFNFKYFNRKIKVLNSFVSLNLPLRLLNADFHYYGISEQRFSRRKLFFEPNIELYHWDENVSWVFTARMKSDFPTLLATADYRNDSDPLNIRLGNKDLRNLHHYDVEANVTFNGEKEQTISLSANYHRTDNQVAYALIFDKTTGASIIYPTSVNGNWNTKFEVEFKRALDKANKILFSNNFSTNYNHSVDMASIAGSTESQRSIVNNWEFGDELKVNYRLNDNYEFTFHTGGKYYLINSERVGFEKIKASDYNIGLNAQIVLPWELQLTTDMTMFARRGYQQTEMNTTDWIWNVQLARTFLKGHLTAKLQGFDLLQQLSNTRYVINSQGRTESWNNSIPRYVMLSLAWKFNINPKKK
ncbi:outer membrane beta-barrel protein [Prevotella nigrescens]|uniref:outer membrane beta-barrel protein n=1 Tax=Prevotella nigrescens TaxID=28133 RepID=UPI001BAB3ADA|nr:outer membrane beta-barrel protein [Prevotella nigrescens]QUB52523.1 outer membrane beta-barrel protein [Prevotella nigrescens]